MGEFRREKKLIEKNPKMKKKEFPEIEYLKTQPSHLQDRLRRKFAKNG